MEQVVARFLKALHVPVSKRYVRKLIQSHPDYPSLLSVSDVFERLGIPHAARRIYEQELTSIGYPYLLPLDKGSGDLLLIRNAAELSKHKEVLQQWGGVVLQAEPINKVHDSINDQLYAFDLSIKRLAIFLIGVLATVILLPLFNQVNWVAIAMLTTALAGAVTGYFLIAKELGIVNKAIDNFCNTGKNTNCDAILKADIKFFGVSLSEVASAYFLFQVVALTCTNIFPTVRSSFLQLLIIPTLLTLPIIGFSLYYQKFVAKTWCKLCLVVVAILFVQACVFAAAYFTGGLQRVDVNLLHGVGLLILFAGLGAIIKLIKTVIDRNGKLNMDASGLRIKHNAEVFLNLLSQQAKIETPFFEKEMTVGNSEAAIQIVMVSNLYCNPCKVKHKVVDQLLAVYADSVHVIFRFVKSAPYEVNGLDAGSYLLGAWLTHAHTKPDEQEITLQLLHDWFALWDLEKFAEKWRVDEQVREECIRLAVTQNAWTTTVGVQQTPTFFLNGYQLPEHYTVDDLIAMLPGLGAKMKQEKKAEVALQPA